ncbi:hypothetical protein BJ138DRAFT_1055060 [Hygrophoropsis aurantiaca]|uniref:Uncharacterized protein n=1 Tax=Hygrophoropsis aurantiaca TaxID=72124 RepID=A0ACB8AQV1_9AGAM|nr:hypothetical protein BJ138DRAFT_1055060 [Hygrophoropsis aurantiaca]
MVGILGLGNRTSPAPEIRPAIHLNGNTRTRSAENPATKTQGNLAIALGAGSGVQHFFSLPHWTRRVLPSQSITRKNIIAHATDELGVITPATPTKSLMLDKDLPPAPMHDSPPIGDNAVQRQTSRSENTNISSPSVASPPKPLRTEPSLSSIQSTAALAQAALQLGIPHTMPRASLSTDINTVNFISSSSLCCQEVRRQKSSQSIRAEPVSGNGPSRVELSRTRGISIGPGITSAKGKDVDWSASGSEKNAPSLTRGLSRRPSFWSRRQADSSVSSNQHLAVPSASPCLPAVQPTSPFQVDFEMSRNSTQHHNMRHSPQLIRRHSERSSQHPPLIETASGPLQTSPSSIASSRSPRRPATADQSSRATPRSPPRRPNTADPLSRFRSRSFFTSSSQISSISTATPGSSSRGELRNETAPLRDLPQLRSRSSTNPPLLHRLSVNIFASSPPSATKTGTFFGNHITSSPSTSSPRRSLGETPPEISKVQAGESPEAYVHRLSSVAGKADIAGILASSGESFHVCALKYYIFQFKFAGDPLDVALRRMLMDIGLPRETQQIDRVMEAFAARYLECNPNLFTSDDHPYILAFSLIMLHTDAFNKSNKRKMTKADYLKNTTLPGIIPEVLDCFYDNIVFAPFIFIEDPLDNNGHLFPERTSTSANLASPMSASGSTLLGRPPKIDPYYLITHDLLDSLRVEVAPLIPPENPYDYEGTSGPWNVEDLLQVFAKAIVTRISSAENSRLPSAFFGLSVGGIPSPSLAGVGAIPDVPPVREIWTIKITMVSLLNRKDDMLGAKKPVIRKWKPFSVVLTGSQLLLFRDPSWASTLLPTSETLRRPPIPAALFKPDEVLSIKDALAVFDKSYTMHKNTFRLVLADGRHILFQTSDEIELNAWISRLNYASAFKSSAIRMRPLAMSGKDVELTGMAAATSHLHDLELMMQQASPKIRSWDQRGLHNIPLGDSGSEDSSLAHTNTQTISQHNINMEVAVAPEVEGASQFKATFDRVKAELEAARRSLHGSFSDENHSNSSSKLDISQHAPMSKNDNALSHPRTLAIHSRVHDLDTRLSVAYSQLDSDMRFVRNVAKLTPFQKSTRDRLQTAVQNISKQIALARLDITRLTCHRNVLLNDLAAEEKCFRRATTLALQKATETLQSRRVDKVPHMTFSFHDTPRNHSLPPSSSQSPPASALDSSVDDSFNSALDFDTQRPSSSSSVSGGAISNFLGVSMVAESPAIDGDDSSTGCYPFAEEDASPSRPGRLKQNSLDMSSNLGHDDGTSHEKFYTAQESIEEQAEEWDKTRAAKRVSLIKLPPDLRLSAILGGKPLRYAPAHDEDIEEGPDPHVPDHLQSSSDFQTS